MSLHGESSAPDSVHRFLHGLTGWILSQYPSHNYSWGPRPPRDAVHATRHKLIAASYIMHAQFPLSIALWLLTNEPARSHLGCEPLCFMVQQGSTEVSVTASTL